MSAIEPGDGARETASQQSQLCRTIQIVFTVQETVECNTREPLTLNDWASRRRDDTIQPKDITTASVKDLGTVSDCRKKS